MYGYFIFAVEEKIYILVKKQNRDSKIIFAVPVRILQLVKASLRFPSHP